VTEPSVSVIIPARDMEVFLGFALSSIWRQNHREIEVIVIDAGSRDGTAELVERQRDEGLPVRLLRQDAIHPARARNIGIAAARAPLIAFLDADDLWPVGKLQRQLGSLSARNDLQMVSGYVTYFETPDEDGLSPMPGSRTETLFHVHVGACIYRRDVFEAIGGAFDETFIYSEDVDLLLRVREAGVPFTILRSAELYYRRHPNSMMAKEDPAKDASLRLAMSKSLRRRRERGTLGTPLPDFSSFLEPLA
jgi:glycosyltransferase involved in cell wall biosynthesis